MNSFVLRYRTKKGKKLPIYTVFLKNVSVGDVALVRPDAISLLCGKCSNNGVKLSCPPYAPEYKEFVGDESKVGLLYNFFSIKDFMRISRNPLIVMKLFTSFQKRLRVVLRKTFHPDYKLLLAGSCEICQSCKIKHGMPCPAHSGDIIYSPESVGVDIGKSTEKLLNVKTMWWRRKMVRPLYFYIMSMMFGEIDETVVISKLCEKFGVGGFSNLPKDFMPMYKLWEKSSKMELPDWVEHACK